MRFYGGLYDYVIHVALIATPQVSLITSYQPLLVFQVLCKLANLFQLMPTISVTYARSASLLPTGRFLGALLEIVSKWHTSGSVYTQVGHCHQQWTELAPWQLVFLFSVVFRELTMALDNLWDVQWNVTYPNFSHRSTEWPSNLLFSN